jgi:hypothetical protein
MLFASFYLLFGLTALRGITRGDAGFEAVLMPNEALFARSAAMVRSVLRPNRFQPRSTRGARIVLE